MRKEDFDADDFREVGMPEGDVYPGFWWVQWSGLQDHSFVVKHLNFRLLHGGTAASDNWVLDGLTDDPGADFICGASAGKGGEKPTLSFSPDSKGRAHTALIDSHGEGQVSLTALGDNLIEGLTGYRLDIDRESELAAMGSINFYLAHSQPVELDDISFELSAEVGAFIDKVWSIALELHVGDESAQLLELDGVANVSRRRVRSPRVAQHLLDMAEFEGYRVFGPLDTSSSHVLHMRSLAAATEAINTPITLDRAFLQLLKEPGEDFILSDREVPRALYIAALMVVGANRTGTGKFRSKDWPEANELSRWALGLEAKSGLVEQRDLIEQVFGAVASLTTVEQAESLIDAELFVAGDIENIEARFPGLLEELKDLRFNLLWRVRRDELVALFQESVENEVERFEIAAVSDNEPGPFLFTVDLSGPMMVQVRPRMHVRRPEFVNGHHEADYWLRWEPDPNMDEGMRVDLDHRLVQVPEVVASLITHAMKHREVSDPEGLTWAAKDD